MKSLVNISACFLVIVVLCIINHCCGKSIYVNYEGGVDEPMENDLVRRSGMDPKQSLDTTETVQSGGGEGRNYNGENPSEQNSMMATIDGARERRLDLHKIISTSDLKVGTSPWIVPVPDDVKDEDDDDDEEEEDVNRRVPMSTKNNRRRQQLPLTRQLSIPRSSTYHDHDQDDYSRWTSRPFSSNHFRPSSPSTWSSRQKSFFFGGVGGPKKRQSILYRQCFFNPISCFK